MSSHRHAAAPRLRQVIRAIGAVDLVLAGCRCGASRRELRDRRGRLVQAGPWDPAKRPKSPKK